MYYLLQYADGRTAITELLEPDATIEHEVADLVAAGFEIISHHEISADSIPTDRTFREAWRHCPQNGIRHCMHTARNIHRDRMREKRKLLFSEVDAAFMRAQMQGLSTSEIAAQAQQLRDVTKAPEIDQVQTVEELKELWPQEVLGETPYVEPIPPPPPPPIPQQAEPEPEPYTWAGDLPLWTRADYDKYMQEVFAGAGGDVADEEPEAAPENEQADLEDFLAVGADEIDLPRMFTKQPPAENSIKDAMRRVEELEAADAPIPEYTPPPEPAREVFADMCPVDHMQRLQNAVDAAYAELQKMRWQFEIAAKAVHGNGPANLHLQPEADRLGQTTVDVAERIIADWRRREAALADITETANLARNQIGSSMPADVEFIVDEAIERIEKGVSDATTSRV